MMVTFVSQCEKKALNRTRRVLDAFANRIGDNTWQTVITQDGLDAVRKLLRKTASRNTAIACHWIRSRARSELVWVVGNKRKFDTQGYVPVNYTESDSQARESTWTSIHATSLMTAIAGLFHDVGKANSLFQLKLNKKSKGKNYEPYRHEWVSLRIFQAFVGDNSDKQWLKKLSRADNETEVETLRQLTKDPENNFSNPFTFLPPVAKLVAWLIVSHHRLPSSTEINRPSLSNIHLWHQSFDVLWNSRNHCKDKQWSAKELSDNWQFPNGTPLSSTTWQLKARSIAEQALSCPGLLNNENWLDDRFVAHLSRLSVMLADHYYSSKSKTCTGWQDPNYQCHANTDKQGKLKQQLDEHNIAVSVYAKKIASSLPQLRLEMPSLESDKQLEKSVSEKYKGTFGWQDIAHKAALELKSQCTNYGFFGINMASTGKGKTRANARIIHALSEPGNCRFSIALGLRTLTLQTSDALKTQLAINDDEIATLIGSVAIRLLHDVRQSDESNQTDVYEQQGSASEAPLLGDEVELKSKLADYAGAMAQWFQHDEKLLRLIQAPVLVSTIDYLIPATEGVRGGRQIAPMLRLLTADLIIDEPDDFGLEDMPALCRLVNWAGMLGCKVLLSTATMPPSLAKALFDAYSHGRQQFNHGAGLPNTQGNICCAWFDECTKPATSIVSSPDAFEHAHNTFVANRIIKLDGQGLALQKGKLLPLTPTEGLLAIDILANAIHQSIFDLHRHHQVQHSSNKNVSIGLVRMANINPLIAVAQYLLSRPAESDYRIHYCVYHSQFPLILRHLIEAQLDKALTRHDETQWWEASGIEQCIEKHDEKNHVFVVLATQVAEVGRDHDYDWAIAEPSSMRSLIQLSGRVQRHRRVEPKTENIYILSTNRKGLQNISPAFTRPGFESNRFAYSSHDLTILLQPEHYQTLSAKPRIQAQLSKISLTQENKFEDFVQLEHFTQIAKLYGLRSGEECAALWWQHSVTWSAELQNMQQFRKSQGNDVFSLRYSERVSRLLWREKDFTVRPVEYIETDRIKNVLADNHIANSNSVWEQFSLRSAVQHLAENLSIDEDKTWDLYTEVQLRKSDNANWRFNEFLGIYEELKNKDAHVNK